MANITEPACSVAFPTIGSKMTLINGMGTFKSLDAPWILFNEALLIYNNWSTFYKQLNSNVNYSKFIIVLKITFLRVLRVSSYTLNLCKRTNILSCYSLEYMNI